MTDGLRGAAAIVGASTAACGEAPGRTHLEIMAEAAHKALTDCGLTLADVDGLFASNMQNGLPLLTIGEYLGVRPKVSDSTNFGGSSFVAYLQSAALALQAGLCEVALICYGSNQRSMTGRLITAPDPPPYEARYRPRLPVTAYALAASRHMHEYGTTREQLAEVAVAARGWANLNPEAFMRGPLTIDDVINARPISDPFTVRDCCLVTDGGGALVMVAAERAADMPEKPIYLLGLGMAHWHRAISEMADLTVTPAVDSGARAFAIAGLTPADVDVAEIYDAFTICTIALLEDLGFVAKGEGGPFVEQQGIGPGGALPVNTNGGGLSCTHPGMYGIFPVIEAVRQLRGACGGRQVPDAKVALAHGNGGTFSSQVTALLGTAETWR